MTVTATDLTTAFPEFANGALFPAIQVDFWLGLANDMLTADLFGDRLSLAVILFTAHNLALSAQASAAAKVANAASFGAPSGLVTSKSVGPISKGMDVTLTAYQGAGPWNATSYGQRYFQLLKAFATGPFYRTKQVTVPLYGYQGAV